MRETHSSARKGWMGAERDLHLISKAFRNDAARNDTIRALQLFRFLFVSTCQDAFAAAGLTIHDWTSQVKPQTPTAMTCMELAQQIEKFQPGASPQEVARLCLLLTNSADDLSALREQRALRDAWKRTGLQLQVATDQHAAMTEELEALAASDPQSFNQEQIWVLIRAIKVQSQVLQMYVGHALIDV